VNAERRNVPRTSYERICHTAASVASPRRANGALYQNPLRRRRARSSVGCFPTERSQEPAGEEDPDRRLRHVRRRPGHALRRTGTERRAFNRHRHQRDQPAPQPAICRPGAPTLENLDVRPGRHRGRPRAGDARSIQIVCTGGAASPLPEPGTAVLGRAARRCSRPQGAMAPDGLRPVRPRGHLHDAGNTCRMAFGVGTSPQDLRDLRATLERG